MKIKERFAFFPVYLIPMTLAIVLVNVLIGLAGNGSVTINWIYVIGLSLVLSFLFSWRDSRNE